MHAQVQLPDTQSDVKDGRILMKVQSQTSGKIPPPFGPVETLAPKYLKQPSKILDVGCETGKNAACLIQNGHTVVLLDIASNAVDFSKENLKKEGLNHGIEDSVVSKIEDLPRKYGPYKAVVGTYAFSFIPPHLFEETMKQNVLTESNMMGILLAAFLANSMHGLLILL